MLSVRLNRWTDFILTVSYPNLSLRHDCLGCLVSAVGSMMEGMMTSYLTYEERSRSVKAHERRRPIKNWSHQGVGIEIQSQRVQVWFEAKFGWAMLSMRLNHWTYSILTVSYPNLLLRHDCLGCLVSAVWRTKVEVSVRPLKIHICTRLSSGGGHLSK